jgi:RND family efflux transporter MFP subunit
MIGAPTMRRAWPLLLAALALAGCGGAAPPGDAAPGEPPFATLTVTPEPAVRERTWDGVIEAVNRATLAAQTSGRVIELPFDVNDYVEAGQVVVRFTDVEQRSGREQALAALRAAEAQAAEAEAEFKRISELVERQLVSRAQLDQVTARRNGARAQLAAAQAALRGATEQVDFTVVRAPYSGILTERHVEVGETVRPGQPLVSGLSLNRLRVTVTVPQSDVEAIRQHKAAAVLLPDGRRIDAAEVVVFPYADPATHTFTVRLELPEVETGLKPGETVKALFKLGETPRLLVPASALIQRGEVQAVYVVDRDGRVELRQIRPGRRYGDRVEVLAGLAEGERIAADPVAALNHLRASRETRHG